MCVRKKQKIFLPTIVIVRRYRVIEIVNVIAEDMEKKETALDIIRNYINSLKPGDEIAIRQNLLHFFSQRGYQIIGQNSIQPSVQKKCVSIHTIDYHINLLKGAAYLNATEFAGEYEVLRPIPEHLTSRGLRREYEKHFEGWIGICQ